MEEKELELLTHETGYLGEDWNINYAFAILRNKERNLKVDVYFTDGCKEENMGYIEYQIEEYKFNSSEELFEAMDKDTLSIRRGLSVTDLIKYSTLKNLCKKLDYAHTVNKK